MKIAQVAPLWERVPPPKYGGIEMGVYLLSKGLVELGHRVTLFAAGTSESPGLLRSVYPKPLYRAGVSWENISYPYLNFVSAFRMNEEFDIIHIHLCLTQDYLALAFPFFVKSKVIFTTRSVLPDRKKENNDKKVLLETYSNDNFISISNSQRKGWEHLNWLATIYNGIDLDKFEFSQDGGDHLVWVGKIRPEKGVHLAIDAARHTNNKLILAGPIDKNHSARIKYWNNQIKPKIDGKNIIYVGELKREQVAKLFQNAKAFINPIQWEEAFGLVMAESQACGTPVITFKRGSASEVVKDKKTGLIVDDFDALISAIKKVDRINREDCRKWAVSRFSYMRMVNNYCKIYKQLIQSD